MRKLFITLCLMMSFIGIFAQVANNNSMSIGIAQEGEKIDNNYLSMDLPEGWIKMEIPIETDTLNGYFIILMHQEENNNNSGCTGIVFVQDKYEDPSNLLKSEDIRNGYLQKLPKNSTLNVGEIHSTTFTGKEAKAIDITFTINGMKAKGAMYALNIGDNTAVVVNYYSPDKASVMAQLWGSVKWKNFSKEYKESFDYKLNDEISTLNNMLELFPQESNGIQLMSFSLDPSAKCVSFRVRLTKVSSQYINEDMKKKIKANMERNGADLIKNLEEDAEFLNKAYEHGYSYKGILLDKDNKKILDYNITYNDKQTLGDTKANNSTQTTSASTSVSTPSKSKSDDSDDKSKIFTVVEQMPMFPGGDEALMNYIGHNLKYPSITTFNNGVQGSVVVGFVVECDGSLTDIHILKSVAPSLDREAWRVVNAMPKWVPGKHNGSVVRVRYQVPIRFRIMQ